MNDLVVKKVNFLGDMLVAAQDTDGNIWAGTRWFCNGLGLSRGQINNENNRIQTDLSLKGGCTKFNAGVFDPYNETLALKLDYIPLWLAKIPITPSMKEENPRLADKLLEYQLKAKDVLAAAFLPDIQHNPVVAQLDGTTLIGLARTGNLIRNTMKDEGAASYEIAEVMDSLFKQGGLVLPKQFVKVPDFSQLDVNEYRRRAY